MKIFKKEKKTFKEKKKGNKVYLKKNETNKKVKIKYSRKSKERTRASDNCLATIFFTFISKM
jgi:hypothetical protein